jgi:hypothetical protein
VTGLTGLRAVLAGLAGEPTGQSPVRLGERVVELRRLIDGLEGVWSAWVAELDGSGELDAHAGTGAWLRSTCRLAPGAARSRLVLARRLADWPAVAAALIAGELSVDHAQLVSTALAELAEAADEDVAAGAEAPLLDAARRCDLARLRREIAHARHALVPDAAAADAERRHARRRLDVATTFDGAVVVDGVLDTEVGELLLTALAPLSGRSGPDDPRTPGQRRADALAELCRRHLDTGSGPALGGERPHLTVLVPIGTLRGVADARGADTGWGGVLDTAAARRLGCDASVSRVLLDADSQPLDVGRRTRVVPAAIRTALAVRDRGCVHPDCDRPPQWTDAHHVRHWVDGGPTSLANLVLLCRRHHRTVHEGRSSLHRDTAGRWTFAMPGPAPPHAA